ncbi:MAG: cytochrome c-type biogenesis protein CcmH [Candidatus Binatia bacterium]|nr:cytochrome c-type biogenesis protein CcmH [Candidatus Binatia bacterium]
MYANVTRRAFLAAGSDLALLAGAMLFLDSRPVRGEMRQHALPAELEAAAKRIEARLVAPCCFAQTVANHYSDVAQHIRTEIRRRLAEGGSETQILADYVRVYGERILAEPLTQGFNLMAYWVPPLAFVAGLGGVLLLLSRWRKGVSTAADPVRDMALRPSEPPASLLHARLLEELRCFDV